MSPDAEVVEQTTYCRICQASCGLVVGVADGQIRSVRGDVDDPLSRGFTCPKGRRNAELHDGPQRLRQTLARDALGHLAPMDVELALDQIASQLSAIIERHGPGAVGLFVGTQSYYAALTAPMAAAWLHALGSPKRFTTMTIDQSAKWVTEGRMGRWLGDPQSFLDADVWLLIGSNPLVSLQGGPLTGFPANDPLQKLKEARRRGLRLIVIDPRKTETASQSDLHLQPIPGHDALIVAAMLHVILEERLHDAAFCDRFANGLDALRSAVRPVTPALAAGAARLEPDSIVEAARLFAGATRGMAAGGTGPDMARSSNLAEHLIRALNVVCGRFQREGEPVRHTGILVRRAPRRAEVAPPTRPWERGFTSRIGGFGRIYGELPTAILPDEILEPGDDQIRALVVSGGNPAIAVPDQTRITNALRALELLVVIDPQMSETAKVAHYVIAPALAFERSDHTGMLEAFHTHPYARVTTPIVPRPPDVVEDWEVFWGLAARLGLQLHLGGRQLDMGHKPTSEELLALLATGPISLDEVQQHPHGQIYQPDGAVVGAASAAGAQHRFELLPLDVEAELDDARQRAAQPHDPVFPHLLAVRRSKELMNSWGRQIPGLVRHEYSPARLHPDDLAALGLHDGQPITIESAHGAIEALAHADPTVRSGVVSMTHCWESGAVDPGAPDALAPTTGQLLTIDAETQTINHMPVMTGVPIRIEASRHHPREIAR